MARTNDSSVWKSVDWATVCIYLALVAFGWFSVCGASHDYGETDLLSLGTRAGKQLLWIGCSLGLGFVLLMLEERLYEMFAYVAYGLMMLLLLVTPFLAEDTKGSYSWLKFGQVSLQPAEFAKFATALALARFMNAYGFTMSRLKCSLPAAAMVLLPMLLIVCQRETGSALVYLSFFVMFYREGMPGSILFAGICAVAYFVAGIRFGQEPMPDGRTSVGEFSVLLAAVVLSGLLVRSYCKDGKTARRVLAAGGGSTLLAYLFSRHVIPFDVARFQYGLCLALSAWLAALAVRDRARNYFYVALFAAGSAGFLFSADYVFQHVLEPHQQVRIRVVLGMEEDLAGAGYNVHQSKIAIGSGGLRGKGFLNGTQTKLKYVPEQDTDFIFCTVGEEEGFLGSAAALLLFLGLILRLVTLAERQHTRFARVYGYSVLSIFLFHVFVNVGMVLGLTPVIGIPLPFFSYGGSSLWGFTILLFAFLRMDAARVTR